MVGSGGKDRRGVFKRASDSFFLQGACIADIHAVAEDCILLGGQIVRMHLAGHVDRDPGFQPQHHFDERPVHIVDDMNMTAFFQTAGDKLHPLLYKVNVLCHFLHRHVIVHIDGAGGVRLQNRHKEIQFRLPGAFNIVIQFHSFFRPDSPGPESFRGNTDRADVLIEIE